MKTLTLILLLSLTACGIELPSAPAKSVYAYKATDGTFFSAKTYTCLDSFLYLLSDLSIAVQDHTTDTAMGCENDGYFVNPDFNVIIE